ncbi:MAG TPA: response regulator [Rickettsiales bacterium]|nr:response regulator [Rickettsiales bacterium]
MNDLMNQKLCVLVIDDNIDDRILCQRELRHAFGDNVTVLEAGSGDSGLEAIETYQPDCVLLDYSLPGRNGVEVLKRIRARNAHIPVIILTGHGNEGVAVEAMKEGAQDYITKSTIAADTMQRIIPMAVEHGEMQKRIDDQRNSLEIFTRALAHDLKEPMRTIQSFTAMILENWNSPDKMQKYFRFIQDATSRMTMLIDTVFLYTQLDAEEQVQMETLDMIRVLKDTKENLNHLISEYGAEITVGTLPYAYANRIQILQVWQNLLSNAIRHGGPNVHIRIGAGEHDGHWLFSVSDDGPGIDPQYYAKVFMPFKRLSDVKEQGAGLGLAICKKIVELHGGTIWCEPNEEGGTSFMFTLPKAQPDAVQMQAVAIPSRAEELEAVDIEKLATILLVDDRKSDIELTKIILMDNARMQCKMLVANDGQEALSTLRREVMEGRSVDLVLLDINMPGIDGFEVLEYIRSSGDLKHIPVIMCTGSTYDEDRRRAEELGADGYLVKPVCFERLAEIVQNINNVSLSGAGDGYLLLRRAG